MVVKQLLLHVSTVSASLMSSCVCNTYMRSCCGDAVLVNDARIAQATVRHAQSCLVEVRAYDEVVQEL